MLTAAAVAVLVGVQLHIGFGNTNPLLQLLSLPPPTTTTTTNDDIVFAIINATTSAAVSVSSDDRDGPVPKRIDYSYLQGTWTDVPAHEAKAYPFVDPTNKHQKCPHVFQHCCIGQCRWMDNRHPNPTVLLKKWSIPLASMLDVLSALHQSGKGCNIFFYGDSLSEDHLMAAACELMQVGYSIVECNSNVGPQENDRVGERDNPACNSSLREPSFRLRYSGDASAGGIACKDVMIVSSKNYRSLDAIEMFAPFSDGGGIVVASYGANCGKNRTTCVEGWYRDTFLKAVVDPALKKWAFAFREIEPPHFSNPGGQYEGPNKTCTSVPVNQIWDWRNKAAIKALGTYYSAGNLPVIPLFQALAPLHFFHNSESEDCQHYCYSPWRFQLTWEGMVRVLDSFAEKLQ